MLKGIESYAGLWMSPNFVIGRMQAVVEKHGRQRAESHNLFKQEREGWTSALFALGQAEHTGNQMWVEIEAVDRTPDTKVHYIDQSKGRNSIFTRCIEVVDWVPETQSPLQVIQQKCAKAYPGSYTLLVLARSGRILYMDEIVAGLGNLKVPFSEIWVVGPASDIGTGISTNIGTTIHLVMVYPSVLDCGFDIRRAQANAQAQKDVLQRLKRGTSTEMTDLGRVWIPIPK
jgi:hypothetical protein